MAVNVIFSATYGCYFAYTDANEYALGSTEAEARDRLELAPRKPSGNPPSLDDLARELVLTGKIGDDTRFRIFDYVASWYLPRDQS